MKRFMTILAAAIALSAGCAHATLINFSFSNTLGNVAGTVTGTLSGLADEGTSAATGITITSAPIGVGIGVFPVGILSLGWTTVSDSVTITSGVVTGIDIDIEAGSSGLAPHLLLNVGGSGVNSFNFLSGQLGVLNIGGLDAISFVVTPTTVREPATLALLGLGVGLAGIGVAGPRRNRDHRAA